jgi:MoaA/NifB/PqqE/SkfB family radical SAM enzyme
MNLNILSVIRILADSDITRTPLRVMSELKKMGKRRVPENVQKELDTWNGGLETLRFTLKWLDGEQITRHGGRWVINSFLPPFPGKAFDRMFDNLLSTRPLSPVSAYLAVTSECPLGCIHCSIKKRTGPDLSVGDWRDAISGLEKIGVSLVGFTGGEPAQRDDLPLLVHEASSRGMESMVFTSGDGFDKHLAEKLKNAGLWAVAVSIDHPEPEKHDGIRGKKGAFGKATEALSVSMEAGFYTMITSVVFPGSAKEKQYLKIFEIAKKLGVHEYRLVEPMPCGSLFEKPRDYLLSQNQISEIRDFHVRMNRKGTKPKICAFNRVESPELFGCGAGTQHLFIDPSGEVCPCDFTPLSFGNICREPIDSIWKRMSGAMGNPRRNCFIQKNHRLIREYAQNGDYPLKRETSLEICRRAGKEPMPDYFALVTGRKR